MTTAMLLPSHCNSPGCYDIHPAALVTEWKDPQEEEELFPLWILLLEGTTQWSFYQTLFTAKETLRVCPNL